MSMFQKKLRKHQKLIEKTKRLFKQQQLEDVKIFEVRPIPDLIIVDFKRKEVIAVECSFHNEQLAKKPKYRKSDFKKVLFVKASRIHPNSNRIKKRIHHNGKHGKKPWNCGESKHIYVKVAVKPNHNIQRLNL